MCKNYQCYRVGRKNRIVDRCITFGLMMAVSLTTMVLIVDESVQAESDVSAKAYILYEPTTDTVIEGNNIDLMLPIASTTKIMSAYITLQQPDLEEKFVVNTEAIKTEGTSMGLRVGDQASLYDLTVGMLLPSGNDAANAAAVRISNSISGFAELMNQTAKEIGMNNTNFTNPSGLHDDEHYSTAYDMALLASVALQDESFKAICSSESIRIEYGNPPYSRTLSNHNKLLTMIEGCVGMKTGFTSTAGRCLVSAVERDGVTLICVTLNASDDWNTHIRLYNSGFESINLVQLECDNTKQIAVVGGTQNAIGTRIEGLPKVVDIALELVDIRYRLQPFYYAPIANGQYIGYADIYIDDYYLGWCKVVADDSVDVVEQPEKTFMQKILEWF